MRIDGENAKRWFKSDYLAMARACESCWDTTPRNRRSIVRGNNGEYYWTEWRDIIRVTDDCPHCEGTGLAPGDGATECGFCD